MMLRKVSPPRSIKTDAGGHFKAYPSTFTRTPDSYGDVIHRNAFDATLDRWRASGNTIPGLFGHHMDNPAMFVASATDFGTDDTGWWVEGTFDLDTEMGAQVHRLVKDRRITQLSFAFDAIDQAPVTLADGTKANELRQVEVYEFSFVAIGANQTTFVESVKTPTQWAPQDALDLRLRLALARAP